MDMLVKSFTHVLDASINFIRLGPSNDCECLLVQNVPCLLFGEGEGGQPEELPVYF